MISAQIVADSICATRITTFLVVMPRYLLAEWNTEGVDWFWRNARRVMAYVYTAKIAWYNAVRRCTAPTASDYPRYGGRGITVCKRWLDYRNFLEDMGEPPAGHTLDRIDPNGPYCRENCRWATRQEQARTRRSNRPVTAFGKTQLVIEWAEETGIDKFVIYARLEDGWEPERAVFTPSQSRSKRRCYEWRGKVWTLADLAKHVQMTPDVLAKRVKAGMTLEEAINKPWRLRAKREN